MMEGGGGNERMGGGMGGWGMGWEGECCCFGDHLIY